MGEKPCPWKFEERKICCKEAHVGKGNLAKKKEFVVKMYMQVRVTA